MTYLRCIYCLWGHTTSLVYAVKSSTKADLLNLIMDASALVRNDKPSLHFHEGPKCAQTNREVILSNYFIIIRVSNTI
jgi:hypothetical protein